MNQLQKGCKRHIGRKERKSMKLGTPAPRQRDVKNDDEERRTRGEKDDEKHGAKANRGTNEQTSEDERREEEESGLRKSKRGEETREAPIPRDSSEKRGKKGEKEREKERETESCRSE